MVPKLQATNIYTSFPRSKVQKFVLKQKCSPDIPLHLNFNQLIWEITVNSPSLVVTISAQVFSGFTFWAHWHPPGFILSLCIGLVAGPGCFGTVEVSKTNNWKECLSVFVCFLAPWNYLWSHWPAFPTSITSPVSPWPKLSRVRGALLCTHVC